MATRSKHLFGPTLVGPAGQSVYSCPDAETALIKHLSLFNPNGLTQLVTFALGVPGAPPPFDAISVPGNSGVRILGAFYVLQPNEHLFAGSSTLTCWITGFGAELEGVTD